jgi:ATP-dependent exoDNAse (exonuclease V) beta subunit
MLHSTVAEEVDQRWHGHGDKLNELSSATNWRSSAEVVRFNNTFFGRMSKFHGIDSYQTVAQLVADKNKDLHGYVRFFNIPKEGIPDPLKPVPEDALEDFEPETIDQFEVMMREIRRQVEHGYSYGKIAVLVDTRNHGAEVVDHLLREKMPIITDEALMLNNCQSVRTVISIMQLLVNAKERSINDSPGTHKYKGFAAEQAGKFEYEYVKNLEAGMDKDKAVSEAINATFDDDSTDTGAIDDVTDIAEANPSTLYMLVETIINKRIPPEQRLHDLPYIAAFQDAVAEYTHNYSNNIVAFLKWWDTVKSRLSITSPDDVDAIKVMTIHKSKGLEFDCVHIPYGSWSLCGNESRSESVWITRESIINAVPDYVAAALPPHMRVTLNSTTADPFSMLNDHYTENMQARKVDGFNRTYVAYTRAKRELCVYYGEYEARGRGIGPDIKNIGGMPDYKAEEDDRAACEAGKIAPFNPDINIALEDYVDADGNIIIGEPTTYVAKEKAPKPVSVDAALEEFKKAMVSRYEVTLDGPGACITSVEPLLAECISDDIDDDPQDTARMQAMDRAAEHGERLHFMLSRINRKKDINRAVRFVRAIFHNDSLCDDAERELHRFFDNPDTAGYVKRWFEDHRRAINEMNIYDPDAPETESKVQRPDRIVWNEDGSIDIVDYKFGVKNPDHDTQVRRYINLLRRLYPNATINGWLWYAENHGKPAHVQPVAQ